MRTCKETPLPPPRHTAASNGHASTVRALAASGASLTAQNRDGQTPLDVAEQWGNTETAPALRQLVDDLAMRARPGGGAGWRVQSAAR